MHATFLFFFFFSLPKERNTLSLFGGLIARQRQLRRGNHSTGHRVQLELGTRLANSTFHWKEKEKKVSDEKLAGAV